MSHIRPRIHPMNNKQTIRSNSIPLIPRDQPIAASFAQQALWFLEQLMGPGSTYNIRRAKRLSGSLNIEALQHSINAIVQRHEALRSCFREHDGEPFQHILPSLQIDCPLIDLQELPPQEREAKAREMIARVNARSFDLERGPLLRTLLVRLSGQDHILLVNVHHIVFDGWSLGIFWRELAAFYRAALQGTQAPLTDLPVQYADYVLWQRDRLQGPLLEQQVAYWKKQLAGLPVLDLPTDFPRPATQSYQGTREPLALSATLTRALKSLSQGQGATLHMTLLAALQVLLHRYCGQDDIAVGSVIAGRHHLQLEGLIGFFVNALVMRSDLSGKPGFRQLLGQVRQSCLDAYSYMEIPFEKLVSELQPQRDTSRNPFFQVMLVLQNTPQVPLDLPGLQVETCDVEQKNAKFDLSISLTESEAGLTGHVEYATDLFKQQTIQRFIGHFECLLEAVVENIDTSIAHLAILTEKERRQLLLEWNDTAVDYPTEQGVHQLFEAQAAHAPEATALVCGEREITYARLNEQANQLAHYLARLEVGPETLVAIAMQRSPEYVVGVLGILKAGGAYVPLDLAYPQERLAFMLEDTGAPVLLTLESMLDQLPDFKGHTVCLDRDREAIGLEERTNPQRSGGGDQLAYVIYTSGSTGLPKGVAVPHRGVARLLFGIDYVQLDRSQTHLLLGPVSFDISTFELWGSLLHGARLVIYPDETPDIRKLGVLLEQYEVSVLWLIASLFNLVIDEAPQILQGVRQLLTGGEALSLPHVRRALEQLPQTRLINGYGPTESTTFTCCYTVLRTLPAHLQSVPIGRPIANTQVYILDKNGELLPIGVPGELYVGGAGLARGYHQRADLTAEKFIPDPYADDTTARLYRSGDRVRYFPDGNIEFLGRLDWQLKIRGFRIEPGEIEATLIDHPGVHNAVVTLCDQAGGGKQLVAWLVLDDPEINEQELGAYLRGRLPAYMAPGVLQQLDALPLTAGGKVDREALEARGSGLNTSALSRPLTTASDNPPANALEREMVSIWEDVLGVGPVNLQDDFFELGGHSLLAVKLVFEIEKKLGVVLPLSALFENPTVETLLEALCNQKVQNVPVTIIAVRAEGSKPPFFLVHGDHRALAAHLDPEQPIYRLGHTLAAGNIPELSVEEIAAIHLKNIKQIQPTGPYRLGGFSFGGMIAFELAQQLHRGGEEVALLALFDPSESDDMQRDSVLRRRLSDIRTQPGIRRKATAVAVKLRNGVNILRRRLRTHTLLSRSKSLPPELRIFHNRELFKRAKKDYEYAPYPGQISLFLPESSWNPTKQIWNVHERWLQMTTSKVTIYPVHGAVSHIQIFEEPHVQLLASQLNLCLAESGREDDQTLQTPEVHDT